MWFCINWNIFFDNHERIQFSHEFRRSEFFDAHHSKAHFKTQNWKYSKKNERNQKTCYEKCEKHSRKTNE